MDSISIVCSLHDNPVRVIDFDRWSPTHPWVERLASSAARKREAAEHRRRWDEAHESGQATGPLDFDRWLERVPPPPDRPESATHLMAATDPSLTLEATHWAVDPLDALSRAGRDMSDELHVATRDNYSIKCPRSRCRGGRRGRSEGGRQADKLWPVLDLIVSALAPSPIGGRSQQLSIPEFWLIADDYDRRVATGQSGHGALD